MNNPLRNQSSHTQVKPNRAKAPCSPAYESPNLFRSMWQDGLKTGKYQRLQDLYHASSLPLPVKKAIYTAYHRIFIPGLRFVCRKMRKSSCRPFLFPEIKPASRRLPDYIVWGINDWHFLRQRPQHIAVGIAATGRRVFYISPRMLNDDRAGFEVEPLDESGRLFQVRLYAFLPGNIHFSAPDGQMTEELSASLNTMLGWAQCGECVSLVQHPAWTRVAASVPGDRLVYDCMDHHKGFGRSDASLESLEKELFCRAEVTIVTSDWLRDKVAPLVRRHVVIRNAGEYEQFAERPANVYIDPQGRRILGYYGVVGTWFDLGLIEELAVKFPQCCILLIGNDIVNARQRLAGQSNIVFTGKVPYAMLPYYLHSFDVCLLPFKIMPLTLATNPVKIYEYLGAGKAVVTVALPEMSQFGDLITVATSGGDFVRLVGEALSNPSSEEMTRRRQDFAKGQTWELRTVDFLREVEGVG